MKAGAEAAFPSRSSLFATGDRRSLLTPYRQLQDLVCYGTFPLYAGITFAAVPVYTFVFNAGVAQRLLMPTAFLALGSWMNATISIPYMLSVAMGKPQIAARLNLYALVIVLPVTFLLVLRFGIAGAGFSWVFYHLFAYGYMVPRICRECLGAPVLTWYVHVIKVIGLGAVTYGPAWIVLTATNVYSLPIAVITYVAASAVFGISAFLMIGPDLRQASQRLPGSLRGCL